MPTGRKSGIRRPPCYYEKTKKKTLRQFDPGEIAELDRAMWQAYYRHRFVRLFFILVRFAHTIRRTFGLSYFNILYAAYNLALAAADFRLSKGKESKDRIVRRLAKAARTLARQSGEDFDYRRAAELELEWWMIDRYPDRYTTTREEGLARAMGAVYGLPPERLMEYARLRARAMTLQDEAEVARREADWTEIERLLTLSFAALRSAVAPADGPAQSAIL